MDKLYPYKGVPKDVGERDPKDITFSGKSGSPFIAEIRALEESAQEIRLGISRYLDTWGKTRTEAQEREDNHVVSRAENELAGLHKLLYQLTQALT